MMKNYLLPLLFSCLAFSCQQAPPTQTGTGEARFRTTAPARLYFKNMRGSQYESQEQAQSRIELYRPRRLASISQRPLLIPVIADNWLAEEAYLFIQPNDFEKGFAEPITIFWEGDGVQGLSTLQPMSIGRQHEFGIELYERLRKGHELQILCADSTLAPVFQNQQDRQDYLASIKDYLRLTE